MVLSIWLMVLLPTSKILANPDTSKYKLCENSSFCRRQRALKPDSAKVSVKPETITLKDGKVNAKLLDDESKRSFDVSLSAIEGQMFRLQINEADGIRQRFSPEDILEPDVKITPLILAKSTTTTRIFSAMDSNHKIVLSLDPFRVDAYSDGNLVLSLNQKRMFKFEYYQKKPRNTKSVDDDDDARNKDKLRKGLWEEEFNGIIDTKPYGPSSVGFDLSFMGFSELFGIPEHADSFVLKTTTGTGQQPYRLYNLDVFGYNVDSRRALYGTVPYLIGKNVHKSIGVFWLNSAEMWVDITSTTVDKKNYGKLGDAFNDAKYVPQMDVHWFAESGFIDLFLLMGPNPHDMASQYAKLTGVTPVPPIWALGHHQTRFSYDSEAVVNRMIKGFDDNVLPVDVIWLDIQHADRMIYFTWDKSNFPDPKRMINSVAQSGRKVVVNIDPHIKRSDNLTIYSRAREMDLFVKNYKGKNFVGVCWPGKSVWLDFVNPMAREYWSGLFQLDQHEGATEDLFIWNDMNEPAVFEGPEWTMPKDNRHYGDVEHRDVHNLYGHYNARATHDGLISRGREDLRPFVLTRSFFAGSQRHTAVWTGDNTAEWRHLSGSIPMLLSLSVAGIPFVGADVGGFVGDPDEVLLVRWYQAGSWYPFFRAHSMLENKPRIPWQFSNETNNLIRTAILTRYRFLPYWYGAFREHAETGLPVMRPLWFEYPNDEHSISTEDQFFIGNSIMVRPITEPNITAISLYLPGQYSAWYDLDTLKQYRGPGAIYVETPLNKTPIYIKGGTIVPLRERVRRSASLMVNDPITLYVALNYNGSYANGTLYLDDGKSFGYRKGQYIYRQFEYLSNEGANGGTITSKNLAPDVAGFKTKVWIERIVMLGLRYYPERVVIEYGGGERQLTHSLKFESMSLVIRKPTVKVNTDFVLTIA